MKLIRNIVTQGLSGKIQNLVFRQVHGKTIVASAPSRSKVPVTAAKQQTRSNFRIASAWAKSILADPETKAIYQSRANPWQTAYNVAVAEKMRELGKQTTNDRQRATGEKRENAVDHSTVSRSRCNYAAVDHSKVVNCQLPIVRCFVFLPLMATLTESPFLLYSDGEGNIFEDTTLYVTGRSGWDALPIPEDEWILLPEGGQLYELPGRRGIGIDVVTGDMRICEKGWAVAAFIPPAHTGLYIAAYETMPDAPTLPLFCYTAAGWQDDKIYVPAVRIEKDIRQEAAGYDDETIEEGTNNLLEAYPHNRLVKHLMENCCMTYTCPAARNLALGRWECPVPVSPACNANCIGCISFQPEDETIVSTQDRLTFKPTAEEIVEFTVPHLETAPFPLVSYGQGCEGEPLLMWETIRDSILEIRKHTNKGSININTNGSKPAAVKALCEAGLNSMRVSMNSARESVYLPYYRPNNYVFNDLIESLKIVRSYGGWTSINYFVFPGMTDSIEEYEALRKLIRETDLCMIQWRNFNIDPDWYLGKIGVTEAGECMGVKQFMELIHEEFPNVKFGYFNPSMERIKGDYEADYAH